MRQPMRCGEVTQDGFQLKAPGRSSAARHAPISIDGNATSQARSVIATAFLSTYPNSDESARMTLTKGRLGLSLRSFQHWLGVGQTGNGPSARKRCRPFVHAQ